METKLTIVWLCHFTNKEIQDKIIPWRRINEFAPWIPSSISIIENDTNVDLHVISPHEYLRGYKTFNLRGVQYHFYNAHIPCWGRHWPGFLKWDYISNFRRNKRITKKLIAKINPDIIHLHGAENAYYSSTILQFITKYPSILTVQGFISKSSINRTYKTEKRIIVEKEIFETMQNSFYRTRTMKEDIKKMNPTINLFWNTYPKHFLPQIDDIKKNTDLVFFATITENKGITDLLQSLAIIKETKPDISLCVIGPGHLDKYKQLATNLGIYKNITWTGFLQTQNDVHKLASQARISVLPTYHDIISGTIIESLFLKIPVVAYNVGSIHELNEKEELISLVEKKNINQLADKILFLLDNPKIRKERAENAYKKVQEMFVDTDVEIRESLLNAYAEVINSFNADMNTYKQK